MVPAIGQPGGGAEFLATAVDVTNDHLRGTLGADVVTHLRTEQEIGTVIRGPFRPVPFSARPGWGRLPSVLVSALGADPAG